jgi:LPS export ABC transporter protein LptC
MRSPILVRRFLGFSLFVAVSALVFVVIRFFAGSPSGERSRVQPPSVDVSLKEIHFTESDASARKWELFAESGEYDKAADKTSLKGIRFVVDRNGKGGQVTLTARHGDYAHASKIVNLQGGVLARTEDGITFETPGVTFDSNRRILRGKGPVRIVDEAMTVEGTGFDFDVNSRDARVHSKVSATITPGKRFE